MDALATQTQDVLLSDIRMPGMDVLALLNKNQTASSDAAGHHHHRHSDLDAAVSAYQQGAFDYLPKPFDIDKDVALVEHAVSHYVEQQQPPPAVSPPASLPQISLAKRQRGRTYSVS